MLTVILSLALLISPQESPPTPSPERVAEVVKNIEQTLKRGTDDERVRLLTRASDVPSKEVAQVLKSSLKSKSPKVVSAAIQGLRWMQHPAALEALQKAYASNKALRKDVVLRLSMLKAIGQHGHVSSIKLLSHEIYASKNVDLIKVRIFGLGMIRHADSLKALFKLMNSNAPHTVQNSMGALRYSLMFLTGVDKGPKRESWVKWWRDNRKVFKMAPLSKAIPRRNLDYWARYWGIDFISERVTRREDRGL